MASCFQIWILRTCRIWPQLQQPPAALVPHSVANHEHHLQGPKKWFAKCDKHYPSRSGQTSLATAVANFTKPRTSHFIDLCMCPHQPWESPCPESCELGGNCPSPDMNSHGLAALAALRLPPTYTELRPVSVKVGSGNCCRVET